MRERAVRGAKSATGWKARPTIRAARALGPQLYSAKAQKSRRKSPSSGQFRQFEASSLELVVHASAEDRRVVVEFAAHDDTRESDCRSRVSDAAEFAAAEVGVQIFALDRDVVGDRVFSTAADCPADAG